MSKIVLDDVISGYGLSKINDNFQKVQDALNNEVLYRDNPEGEPNTIEQDIDVNGFSLYNVDKINGVAVDTLTDSVDVVVANIADINTVADNIDNVNVVADINSDVTVVSGIADDVSALAPYAPDVSEYTAGFYAAFASSDSGKGAELVEYQNGTVETALDTRLPEIENYAALRVYTGPVTAYYVRGVTDIFDGGAGVFRVDAADATTADNGGTVLVDASGRRWKREFSGDINVKWFGAVGDGVTDDTAAIQAAFNASNNVIIDNTGNDYIVSSELTLNSNSSLVGINLPTIRQITQPLNVFSSSVVSNVTIDGIRVFCSGLHHSGYTDGHGILFSESSFITIKNCVIENHDGGGIVLTNTNDSIISCNTLKNSVLRDNTTYPGHGERYDIGIIRSSSRNRILNNLCTSITGSGIYVKSISDGEHIDNNIICGNIVTAKQAYGIIVYRNSQALPILQSGYGNIISENIVDGVTGEIMNTAPGANDYSFGAGIYVQGCEDTIVSNNQVKNTHTANVTFSELLAPGAIGTVNCRRVLICNNNIKSANQYGIYAGTVGELEESFGILSIHSNTITTTTKDAVKSRRGSISISDNKISVCSRGIYHYTDTESYNIEIKGNQIQGSSNINACIMLSSASNFTVSGNMIYECSGTGINTDSGTSHGKIYSNVIQNAAVFGINIDSTSNSLSVVGNDITYFGASSTYVGIRLNAATYYKNNKVISAAGSNYGGSFSNFSQLTINSPTPSVKFKNTAKTANTAEVTITNFTDGHDDQDVIILFGDSNTTIQFSGSNIKGNNGVDKLMPLNSVMHMVFNKSLNAWICNV